MEELNTKCRKKLRLSTEIFAVYLENDTSRPIVIVDTNDKWASLSAPNFGTPTPTMFNLKRLNSAWYPTTGKGVFLGD